jgi:hypothetical protein
MPESCPILLRFDTRVPPVIRARMTYAFRIFAAIYSHSVVERAVDSEAIQLIYASERPDSLRSGTLWIPARYRTTSVSPRESLRKHIHGNEDFYLFFGVDDSTGVPDWLGEIFAWISSSLESSLVSRDSVGRVPYSETIFHRMGISPRKPYAAMIMAWFEKALPTGRTLKTLPRAPSPFEGIEHAVVCSHDVDFYFTDNLSAAVRLLKNLGISILTYRSWSFFRSNAKMLAQLVGGRRVGDYLPALIEHSDRLGFQSTVFVTSKRMHRRDPNYDLAQLSARLAEAMTRHFSVGIHGSYRSVVEAEDLLPEVCALARLTGAPPRGGRQHWLRFDRHEKLFATVEKAGLLYDSSLGFHERVGFRNGASFAFPPYDFKNEKAHEFLEIPLAIMDGSLEVEARLGGVDPQAIADETLAESRKWGWGGISVLWHNPLEPTGVPEEINRVFWESVKKQRRFQEKWMTADQFIAASLSRYHKAGLLQTVRWEPPGDTLVRMSPPPIHQARRNSPDSAC